MANINISAIKKIISATLSKRKLNCSFNVRIDKNERKLAAINNIEVIPVNSSIIVSSLNLETLSDVKTIRQKPNKLEDVFNICVDLLFILF